MATGLAVIVGLAAVLADATPSVASVAAAITIAGNIAQVLRI